MEKMLALTGNEAAAYAMLQISPDVVAAYPITPQTELMHKFAEFVADGKNSMVATFQPLTGTDIRIVWQQFDRNGLPKRSAGDYTGKGSSLGSVLIMQASQNKRDVPVEIHYDKSIWSGLAWAAGEIRATDFDPHSDITIRCTSMESEDIDIHCRIFSVIYE